MAYRTKTAPSANDKRKSHDSARKGETVVQERQAVVNKKKFMVTSAVAKTVAGVLLRGSLATATSVMKMKKPSLKTILKDADEFQRRLQTGETRVLTPEEGGRRLAAVLEKQREMLEKFHP